MKAMKKLVPAICLLLISAVLLGTSTFAWFSMNTSVTASGMSVTAKSDAAFLQIKGTSDSSYSTAGNSSVAASLLPVSHADITLTTSTVATPGSWWYGYSDKADSATLASDKITCTDLTNYVASATFTVGLTSDSGVDSVYDLYVSSITIGNDTNTGIRAIVVGPDALVEFDATDSDGDNTVALANTVGKQDNNTVTITVYFYVDGQDTNVYTNNISALTGSISLTLACYTTDTINANSN